jgi:signal peptidase I
MNEKLRKSIKKSAKEWIAVIGFFAVISCFLYQPFKIPSSSMVPTLLVGDFLIVNKFCYGYSNDSFRIASYTFPLPKIGGRLLQKRLPQRGEVVVFRNEKDGDLSYIKRIIGLPGDTIQLIDGIVHINGTPTKIRQIEDYSIIENGEYRIYKRYMETLPNGYEHVIIKIFDFGQAHLDNTEQFVVPEGHYFMMGDNRDNSKDSRVMEAVGFIPLERIMGRAECLFFSSSCRIWEIFDWFFSMRFERFFTAIM